jgi:hypothetical protein
MTDITDPADPRNPNILTCSKCGCRYAGQLAHGPACLRPETCDQILTADDVRNRMFAIKQAAVAEDDERAHSLEDRLYHEVLKQIACGHITGERAAEVAAEALTSKKIDFERYCA